MEKIRLDWVALTPVETDRLGWFNVGMTDRYGPAEAAGPLIGDNDTRLDSPHLQRLVRQDRCIQTRFAENEGLDPGMAAAIFRLSRRSVFIQMLPSGESTRSLIALGSWQAWIEELDRGTGCLLPKMGIKEGGESACMTPQGIIGRQPASRPLVVLELDMTVDPR